MIIPVKKRVGEKNGRLSIIGRKSVKMDFPENKNKSDNDIFKTTERIKNNIPEKGSLDKRIDQYIKTNSLYVNGKRNENFKVPHLMSQVVIGDVSRETNKSATFRETNSNLQILTDTSQKPNVPKGKSRNVGNNIYKTNSQPNSGVVEIFGSVNKSRNNDQNNNFGKNNLTPSKRLDFTSISVSSHSVCKQNFLQGSMDNPLRTSSPILESRSFTQVNVEDDGITAFHSKMQNQKLSTINQKIKEREKVADLISKSFVNEKQKSKENYVRTLENRSFFDESRDHAYSRSKRKNNNFETEIIRDCDLSFGDHKDRKVDQYYTINFEPTINMEKLSSKDSTRTNDYREKVIKQMELKRLEKKTQEDKKPLTEKQVKTIEQIEKKKLEIMKLSSKTQIKDEMSKTAYYMTEIKKLKEKEKLLKTIIKDKPKGIGSGVKRVNGLTTISKK